MEFLCCSIDSNRINSSGWTDDRIEYRNAHQKNKNEETKRNVYIWTNENE